MLFKNIYIANIIWIFIEKVMLMIGGLLIGIYTARYLGPDKYGLITFIVSITSLIVPIAELGIKTNLFDRTSRNKIIGQRIISETRNIRFSIFIIISILSVIYFCTTATINKEVIFLFIIMLISEFYKVIDVFGVYFNATLNAKVNTINNQVGFVFSQLSRLILVSLNCKYYLFTIPYLFLTILPFYIKRYLYQKKFREYKTVSLKARNKYKKFFIFSGIPVALSELSILIYVKIGQIFIGNYSGNMELGVYSATNIIAQAWTFIPITIITVLLSKVFGQKKDKEVGFCFTFMISIFVSFFIILILSIIRYELMYFLYGSKYISGVEYFNTLLLSSFFVVLGTFTYRLIIHLGGYAFLVKKMIFVAVFNIILSFYLIKNHGPKGAAYAILITEILSFIFNLIYNRAYIFKLITFIPKTISYVKKSL